MLPPNPFDSAKAAGLRYVTGEGPGIARLRNGKGFRYIRTHGRAHGKPVRDKSTLKRIASLAIPPAWKDVWICGDKNGHIQAAGRDARGRKQYRYHPHYREVRDQTKFDRMYDFGIALPGIRKQVNKDLSRPGLEQRKVIAAIVRLLDETCVRIGNYEYAKSNKSFGLTTLRNRHAHVRGDKIRFRFRGKSNQEHDITLQDRSLARIVKRCEDLPGQELFQYQSDTGEIARVDSADVNEYLREITQEDFTAKDFRTWHGSSEMVKQLLAFDPASSETETKRNLVQAVKETARLLGNRPAACRKYYIHPAVFESYLKQTVSTFFKAAGKEASLEDTGLRAVEAGVLQLVKAWDGSAGDRPAVKKHQPPPRGRT